MRSYGSKLALCCHQCSVLCCTARIWSCSRYPAATADKTGLCTGNFRCFTLQSKSMAYKNLLILYTGGTIGMQKNKEGAYAPVGNVFLEKIKELIATKQNEILEKNQLVYTTALSTVLIDFLEYTPLLDSSNMSPNDWIKMAKDIEKYYNKYDGFIILHGTDTLEYTASALSFMLENLKKPIVLTGSMISMFDNRSDAVSNLETSLVICADYAIPEVVVVFGRKVLRGNRCVKISSTSPDAFASPNLPELATIGTTVKVNSNLILKPSGCHFAITTNLNPNVTMHMLCPTATSESLLSLLKPPIEGVVVATYGSGNVPTNQNKLLDCLANAVKKGMMIVNVSQCMEGGVSASYETGKILEDIGVVSGFDMTPAAALTKLSYVLGKEGLCQDERARLMQTNLRGELTVLSK